jgi:putative ABC transport system permease protein
MLRNFFLTAWRNLARNKIFTLLNVSGLAIGITVCLLIGIWLQRELSYDNFHPDGDKIFRVVNTFRSESESFSQAPSGTALGLRLPQMIPSVESGCRVFGQEYKLTIGNKQFIEKNAIEADSNFFNFFGFQLKAGRPGEVLQRPDQIVLTESAALRYFGKSDPVGKTIVLDGKDPMTVSGIARDCPLNSQIQFDILVPTSHLRKLMMERWHFDMNDFWVGGWPMTFIKLKDPGRYREAEKMVNEVVARNSQKEWKENKMNYHYNLQPLKSVHLQSSLRYDASNNGSLSSVLIFGTVGLIVLLLACINYINLTTAGAMKRAKETSVRKVVGASRPQLVRQFFVETLIICAVAVSAGLVLLKLILPPFSAWIGQPYDFVLSPANLFLLFGFTLLISMVAGFYPSYVLSSFNPATALKGNFSQGRAGQIIRKSLVVFQFTITVALVASILIISRQMNYVKEKSLGYNGKAIAEISFDDGPIAKKYPALRTELLKNPHILNVSLHSGNVVGGLGNGWTTTENLKGEEISTSLYGMNVDSNYFDTYDMKLAAGRFFSSSIPTDTSEAVIVNEAAVRTFGWQKPENAIGKRFGKGKDIRHVIGVVKDFNFESLHKPVEALAIGFARYGFKISVKMDAAHLNESIAYLKQVWGANIGDTPLDYHFVDESIEKQYGNEQKMEGIFYGFSAISLLIACLGLFGLSIFIVERKVKEIGIRKVLGASITGIVALISRGFLKLVILAALIASPLSYYFMHQWLQNFAYRINIGPWVFLVSGITALGIALLTICFKAIGAAMANPVKSLRTE